MRPDREALRAELEAFLAGRLGAGLRLVPFETGSAKVVYRAERPDGPPLFVKLVSDAPGARLKRLTDALDLPFVAKVAHLLPWRDGRSVLCQVWQKGALVPPERMNAAQTAALVEATRRLQARLGPGDALLPPRDPRASYAVVADFARRHPVARPFLRALLDIPESARTYDGLPLATIHGDQHYENYLFDGDDVSAIMDFEAVTRGLAVQDLAYAVARRYYKVRLTAAARANLDARFRQMVAARPGGREWTVAVNLWRLLFAARRLKSHPHFGPVACLVWKRDRALRRMLSLL